MFFEVQRAELRGQLVLRVFGELDIASGAQLTAAIDSEADPAPLQLIVDLTHTIFLDSSGARSLAQAARRAESRGTELSLLCPVANKKVRRALDLLQLGAVIPILDGLPPAEQP